VPKNRRRQSLVIRVWFFSRDHSCARAAGFIASTGLHPALTATLSRHYKSLYYTGTPEPGAGADQHG